MRRMAPREATWPDRGVRRVALTLALAMSLIACGDSPGSDDGAFANAPLTSAASDSGALTLSLRTSPDQPPVHGSIEGELAVTDASGAPVDGLALDVVPFMPAMGHGTSVPPALTPIGGGRYAVKPLVLFMAGRWELVVAIGGGREDRASLAFDVR